MCLQPYSTVVEGTPGRRACSVPSPALTLRMLLPPSQQDADLIVLEFSANDKKDALYTDPERRGYEQLVRKLLQLPGRCAAAPARACLVLYTHPMRKPASLLLLLHKVHCVRSAAHQPQPPSCPLCAHRPALIQLHHYAWWHAVGDGVHDGGLFYHPAGEAQLGVFASVS